MSGGSPVENYKTLRDDLTLREALVVSECIMVRNANEAAALDASSGGVSLSQFVEGMR